LKSFSITEPGSANDLSLPVRNNTEKFPADVNQHTVAAAGFCVNFPIPQVIACLLADR